MAMPIYEYECRKCGCRFDVMRSFSDPPVTKCENNGCRGKVRKVISPPAIVFKGSGFYVTDHARGGRHDGAAEKKPSKDLAEGTKSPDDTKTPTPAKSED